MKSKGSFPERKYTSIELLFSRVESFCNKRIDYISKEKIGDILEVDCERTIDFLKRLKNFIEGLKENPSKFNDFVTLLRDTCRQNNDENIFKSKKKIVHGLAERYNLKNGHAHKIFMHLRDLTNDELNKKFFNELNEVKGQEKHTSCMLNRSKLILLTKGIFREMEDQSSMKFNNDIVDITTEFLDDRPRF